MRKELDGNHQRLPPETASQREREEGSDECCSLLKTVEAVRAADAATKGRAGKKTKVVAKLNTRHTETFTAASPI